VKARLLEFPSSAQASPAARLDALLSDPAAAKDIVNSESVAVLQIEVASRQIKLASVQALLASIRIEEKESPTDRMLTANEVAIRLGTTAKWVYKNWKTKLPFGVKVSAKQLRFSERRVERLLAIRAAA